MANEEQRAEEDILRRAIGFYQYLHDAVGGNPYEKKIAILDKNNEIVEILRW